MTLRFSSEEKRAAVAAFFIVVGLVLMAMAASSSYARDIDGRWANSPNANWFKSLKNKAGALCCDGADGQRVEDPDWKTDDGKFVVRLKGKWIVVPADAIITEPSRVGQTMVWPYEFDGQTLIRCFMPGAMG